MNIEDVCPRTSWTYCLLLDEFKFLSQCFVMLIQNLKRCSKIVSKEPYKDRQEMVQAVKAHISVISFSLFRNL